MSSKGQARKRRKDGEVAVRLRKTDGVVTVSSALIRWSGLSFLGFCALRISEAWAGGVTVADVGIAVRILGSVPVSQLLAWAFGIAGIFYGYRQDELRKSTVEKLHAQIRKYEEILDPRRSSSSLTPRGETRKEDEP